MSAMETPGQSVKRRQTSNMESSATILNGKIVTNSFWPLAVYAKLSILDVTHRCSMFLLF